MRGATSSRTAAPGKNSSKTTFGYRALRVNSISVRAARRIAQCDLWLPTSRISDARSRVPRNRNDFVEGLLNPDGIVIVEMNDRP
jgi:hypothetical protein